ncbi:transmembrane protein 100-like [Oncorhynchus mykiss]|uniref:transmembrane protein 100-like n=1 Tax=Oncorhynchus mykiss TaxID=8022 RepID=UPI001877BFD3|nr:transmembrane protein 100-like [Oncorhynchus mykiss]XP_036790497.1 transmembrane protein 100-like [Oncorhynchus mykiss]
METLDPSALPGATTAVTYDSKSEMVTLPGGVVSVAGITVITGGAELSCGSCMLAFGVWGTLIGLSVVALGIWDQSVQVGGQTSHLLGLGLVVLAISFGVVGSVVGFRFLTKGRREITREEREDGKVVLIEERGRSVKKTVTV